ncbi:translation initiation factor eIF-2B subunit gamma [Armigeres subalbatus]|uniref:translation initiation factor eIF-2B subunit gamma n=1 Tax=Armigeres subalbatus TaxID=124917 RepID=UPI002ED1C29E
MSAIISTNEFQAVVFAAGKGSRFPEILEGRPKCLLPIGSYPLIWYPLKLLQRHGFQDVIIIVLEHEKFEIQQKIEKHPLKLKIEYFSLSGDSDVGTADALRQISDRIKTDVVLLSCDTLVDFSLYPALKQFREQNASLVGLLVQSEISNVVVPGPKMKYKSDQDLFGICPESSRLVFMGSVSDFENDFQIPGHLLRQNGEIDIRSGLLDAHVYIVKKWIVDYLELNANFSTLKGELLPFIVKKQLSSFSHPQGLSEKPISEINVDVKGKHILEFAPESSLDTKIQDSSIFNKVASTLNDVIRCYAVVTPPKSFGIRINTLPSFCYANQQIYNIFPALTELPVTALVATNCVVKSNQIASTAIGDQSVISEKTSINASTIGANCVISPKVRLTNCTLMDHVIVEENVTLENCIVCEKSIIKSNSLLRNSLIGSNYTVPVNTKKDNVHLSNSAGFMEI